MSQAKTTFGRRERPISRGGRLVRVKSAAKGDDPGISRRDCGETKGKFEAIYWRDFFEEFGEKEPALVLDRSRYDRPVQRKHF